MTTPTPPEPVGRKRTETLIPFATRIPLQLQQDVKAYCEQSGELITDFTTQALQYLLDLRRSQQ